MYSIKQTQKSYHKAVVVHVHDEILAHDSQTNQCNVCSVKVTVITVLMRTRGLKMPIKQQRQNGFKSHTDIHSSISYMQVQLNFFHGNGEDIWTSLWPAGWILSPYVMLGSI